MLVSRHEEAPNYRQPWAINTLRCWPTWLPVARFATEGLAGGGQTGRVGRRTFGPSAPAVVFAPLGWCR